MPQDQGATRKREAPAGPAGGLQPRVSVEERSAFRDADEARHLARLQADTELMLRLSAEGFEGTAWTEVSRALVEYGYTVMRAWVATGEVFIKCREKGLTLESARSMPRSDALVMAEDTVADAIINFRDYILKKRRWDPAKGASLTTFFVGNCLLRFPNVYRRWLTEQKRMRRHEPLPVDGGGLQGTDPAADVVGRDTSARRVRSMLAPLNDRQRAVLELRADGWGIDEIAELLELSYKQVESLIYRARQKLRVRGASA